MDIESFRALRTPSGQAVLAEACAADVGGDGLLATAARLRERHDPDLVAAALTQARLRERAKAKFGADAERMYFTEAGLEQSTRAGVAAYRAGRFADGLAEALADGREGAFPDGFAARSADGLASRLANPPPTGARVLELGCGIGADLVARARAGLAGDGVELDPLTAEVAQANVEASDVHDLASVRVGDAVEQDPSGYAAVFADPGRRTARGRVFDPRAYEPPLDTVLDLAGRTDGACVKVAPGIPHEAVPAGAEAEWISVGGDVKEAALWLGRLAGGVPRRATLLPADGAGGPVTLTPRGLGDPDVRPWGRYLYEPDGAVIRAHLVAEVAELVGGGLADPRIAYVTSDEPHATPFAAGYEIEDVLPFSVKRLRAELRRRDVGVLTVKKRGSAVDVDKLRRDLGFGGRRPRGRGRGRDSAELTVVVTRVGREPVALLVRPPAAEPAARDAARPSGGGR